MYKNFENIDYLKNGTITQKHAYFTLTKNNILNKLQTFDPILVGTIPLNIDIKNSDLDIICSFQNKDAFVKEIKKEFSDNRDFKIREVIKQSINTVIANFETDDFEIEIFGQNIPTRQQNAYRHMMIEYHLLCERDETFRQNIIDLKRKGYKTEPAFGIALGLKGDPYKELLTYEEKTMIKQFDKL
mgnify:CR=1 FL=1